MKVECINFYSVVNISNLQHSKQPKDYESNKKNAF